MEKIQSTIWAVGTVVSGLLTATGIGLDFVQVSGIDTKLWIAISFLSFCVFIVLMFIGLQNKNRELENKKPTISVSADHIMDNYYLTVTNNGERGIFKAELAVFRDRACSIGEEYEGLWGKANSNTSEILKTHSDFIKIASVIPTKSEQYLALYGYSPISGGEYIVRSIKFNQLLNPNKMPEFIVRINISSDPSLREREFIGVYEITLSVMSPTSLLQRKVSLIPIGEPKNF